MPPYRSSENIKILVAEDEIIVAEDIKEILEEFGYNVVDIVDSGEQAVTKVSETQPDLVLMDICLRGKIDGIQAAEEIWHNYQIPIVYLTANSDIGTLQRVKTTEPFGYITKPFKERELQTAVEIALNRYHLEKKLKEKEQWLKTILNSLGDGIIATDEKNQVILLNPAAEVITGWKYADAVGKESTEIFKIADEQTRVKIECPAIKAINLGCVVSIPEHTILLKKNGSEVSIDDTAAPIKNDLGQVRGAVVVFRDITERKRSQKYAQTNHEVTLILAESPTIRAAIPQLLQTICLNLQWDLGEFWLLDRKDRVLRHTTSWHLPSLKMSEFTLNSQQLTFSPGIGLPGLAWKLAQPVFIEDISTEANFLRSEIAASAGLKLAFGVPIVCENKLLGVMTFFSGKSRSLDRELVNFVAPFGSQTGQFIKRKVSEAAVQKNQQHLAWQAKHDALTGLVNRREFENCLKIALHKAILENQQHSLCYLDLDRFKIVNDSCGHEAGDELLRQVTNLLQKQIRTSDILARLGGDEFALLLPNCPSHQALSIANALRQSVEEFRFSWENKVFTIGVSIGLVAIDAKIPDLVSAIGAADAACYIAKNTGRNRVHFYQIEDRDSIQQQSQIKWVDKLTQALQEDSFCLYYQSIVPLSKNAKCDLCQKHYEILLRLKAEDGSCILPMAFIPAAERYHLMEQIDRWVIRTLFKYLETKYCSNQNSCQERQDRPMYAINLSGASINDDKFIDFCKQQFATYRVPPEIICFEITETVAITNLTKARSFIEQMKYLGCRFALDDFGSGMSSFAYLKNLPVDYLKIDGAFIKNMIQDPTNLALTNAINQIGHVMGLQTIGEFVENDEILAKITEMGIDYAQGYAIDRPKLLSI